MVKWLRFSTMEGFGAVLAVYEACLREVARQDWLSLEPSAFSRIQHWATTTNCPEQDEDKGAFGAKCPSGPELQRPWATSAAPPAHHPAVQPTTKECACLGIGAGGFVSMWLVSCQRPKRRTVQLVVRSCPGNDWGDSEVLALIELVWKAHVSALPVCHVCCYGTCFGFFGSDHDSRGRFLSFCTDGL